MLLEDQKLSETELPFLSMQDRFMMRSSNGLLQNNNKQPLVDAFFKEESRDFDDFYTMEDNDENRSCMLLIIIFCKKNLKF
jgi:hypothetical protein